jgi:hypothetical protein
MAAKKKVLGVYLVQGFADEAAQPYMGVTAGQHFPAATNGDHLDGKYLEDFYFAWRSAPWDAYLERARAETPAIRVVYIEMSSKLPYGRKLSPKPETPEWITEAEAWSSGSVLDGVELGVDVLEPPGRSKVKELLFDRPAPALAAFRERLNGDGLFADLETAAAFVDAALAAALIKSPTAVACHRLHWLRTAGKATGPLWRPA